MSYIDRMNARLIDREIRMWALVNDEELSEETREERRIESLDFEGAVSYIHNKQNELECNNNLDDYKAKKNAKEKEVKVLEKEVEKLAKKYKSKEKELKSLRKDLEERKQNYKEKQEFYANMLQKYVDKATFEEALILRKVLGEQNNEKKVRK